MAEFVRTVLTQLVVAGITGVGGFGSAWYLKQQEAQQALALKQAEYDQQLAAAKALREQDDAKSRRDRIMAMFGDWQTDEFANARKIVANRLKIGPLTYEEWTNSDKTTATEKAALERLTNFFQNVRSLAAADELDGDRARRLFAAPALWWGQTALPALMAGYDLNERKAPGDLLNAACGLMWLGMKPGALPIPPDAVAAYRQYYAAAASPALAPVARPMRTSDAGPYAAPAAAAPAPAVAAAEMPAYPATRGLTPYAAPSPAAAAAPPPPYAAADAAPDAYAAPSPSAVASPP
ncbi:MAG: hypothetical protein AB7M12_01080 [Hyphomonadaceae bacterium]